MANWTIRLQNKINLANTSALLEYLQMADRGENLVGLNKSRRDRYLLSRFQALATTGYALPVRKKQ